MSGLFGRAAARLSGQAALLLGWLPDAFWSSTPEELATVLAAMRGPEGDGVDRATLDRLMEHDGDG